MPAIAQQAPKIPKCPNYATYEKVTETLSGTHGQQRIMQLIGSAEVVFEIFASPDETWTLIVTNPVGVCGIAHGQGFKNLADALIPAGVKI